MSPTSDRRRRICRGHRIGRQHRVFLSEPKGSRLEKRLNVLTAFRTGTASKPSILKQARVLTQPLDQVPGLVDKLLSRFGNFDRLLQQADTRCPSRAWG